jgi:hypothetical protein
MQVIYIAHVCSVHGHLFSVENHDLFTDVSTRLEGTSGELITQYGWQLWTSTALGVDIVSCCYRSSSFLCFAFVVWILNDYVHLSYAEIRCNA